MHRAVKSSILGLLVLGLAGCIAPPANEVKSIDAPGPAPVENSKVVAWSSNLTDDLALRIDVELPAAGDCMQRVAVETSGDDRQGRFLAATEFPGGGLDWTTMSGAYLISAHAGPVMHDEEPPLVYTGREREGQLLHDMHPFPETFTTWIFAHGLIDTSDYVENGSVEYRLECSAPISLRSIQASRHAFLFDETTPGGGVGWNIGLTNTGSIQESFTFDIAEPKAVRFVIDNFGAAGQISWHQPSSDTWTFNPEDHTLNKAEGESGSWLWTVDQVQPYYGGFFGVVAGLEPIPSLDAIAALPE